jgi:multiple sugar transport system ATP-binding protein
MATIEFRNIDKIFADGTHAVRKLSLNVNDGEFMVFVGPSGCGKSTLLRMLAGLDTVSSGEILIAEKVVNDWTPQQRNIAMVFQNYALYPHMTVRRNLEFPLRMAKMAKPDRRRRIEETAELLGLSALLDRKPKQLSGGQRQRVAMGRAVVRNPSVFLMDEPLSNLDAKLRVQIRTEIAALQERLGTTTIYVTHDQVEAMTLGQRVAILRDGMLQQVAPPNDLYNQPTNIFVAGFLGNPGMNLFPVRISQRTQGNAVLFIGEQRLDLSQDEILKARLPADQPMLAGLRPEALIPASEGPRLTLVVDTIESLGHEQLVYGHLRGLKHSDSEAFSSLLHTVGHSGDQLIARLPAGYSVCPGNDLTVGIDEARLYLFDIEGEILHSPATA